MIPPLAALLCLAVGLPALAHEAWVDPSGPSHAVRYGHFDQPGAADAARIVRLQAVDASGKRRLLPVARDGEASASGTGAALFLLDYDNGYWSKTPEGSRNLPRSQAPGALSTARVLKYGKTVLAWTAPATQAHGQRLEIVPLGAGAPRAGGSLDLQVRFDGRPLAGAVVQREGEGHAAVRTDGEGRARIALGGRGAHMIVALHSQRIESPEADSERYSASLVFTAE
jgi:nickel transport protein